MNTEVDDTSSFSNNLNTITIHDVLKSLNCEKTLDGASFVNSHDIIKDHLDDAVSIAELMIKPNITRRSHQPKNTTGEISLLGETNNHYNLNSSYRTIDRLHHDDTVMDNDEVCQKIMNIVNENGVAAFQSTFGSTVVESGKIKVVKHNGRIEVVGPGRWMMLNIRASWGPTFSLNDNLIQYETLTVVRIPKGFYGLAVLNGKPLILAEGIHVRNTRLFEYSDKVPINQEHIKHLTINILRIPQGKYGKVVENNVPKLLSPGVYVTDSNYFTYHGLVDVNDHYIQHYTNQIIRIPKAFIGLATVVTKPLLLHEGLYFFNDPKINFKGMVEASNSVIIHSPITRFRINNGEIGLSWWQNKPLFIQEPGVYEVDSVDFIFKRCVPINTKKIVLGSSMRIVVYDGEVGVNYTKGRLEILPPGTYLFANDTDRTFDSFISTKYQSIPLTDVKEPVLRCDTKDFVEIGIKADVFFRISNPKTCLMTVGNAEAVFKLIKDQSVATIQSILRSTTLNQVAQSKTINVQSETESGHSPVFFDKIHDEFISKLHEAFRKNYGVEISNIRIEEFTIINQGLAKNFSKQAIITAETETKLANLDGQREIDIAGQERLNSISSSKATAEAFKLKTETEAKNKAALLNAETQALQITTLAKARAEARTIESEAQARAIEIKSLAMKKRAENLGSTHIGQQYALLSKHHDMVIESMKSVQQVVYLPSKANMGCLPLQMFGMKGEIPTFDSITATPSIVQTRK